MECRRPVVAAVLKESLRDAQDSPDCISQNPSQKGSGSRIQTPKGYEGLLDLLIWLGFCLMSALSPNPIQGRGMLKKPPRVRDNNGALQVRLRLDGRDHFINRLGRWDDPVAQARGQAICAEIWRDAQQGDLDLSLNRYRPLVEGRDQDLLDALRSLAEEKRQARVTHAYRVVKRFGLSIRTRAEVDRFLVWMKAEGLAASTQSTILSTIQSVQPGNKALRCCHDDATF